MSAAAGWRSYLLIAVFSFGVVFALLYAAPQLASPGHAHSTIPTEPRISQLQVINTVEKHVRTELSGTEEIKLIFFMYNFSLPEYQADDNDDYVEYRSKLRFGWNFTHVKQHPELLNIPLQFVDANGAVYRINATDHSYEKACDGPSPMCPMGRLVAEASRDRLVYVAETAWFPFTSEIPVKSGYHVIDAETGEIVWNDIDYEKNRKPMPNVNFDNKTMAQLFRERLNPPGTAQVFIPIGASNPGRGGGYQPEEMRVTLSIDNRVAWINSDSVPHTVVSDNGYDNPYTGRFESEEIAPGATFEYTFFDAGRFEYHCEIHPHMKGAVEVLEGFS